MAFFFEKISIRLELTALADCGEPEIPAFGEVTITTSSLYQEARYNCRAGYELQGTNLRTCYGRDWNGEQPICNSMN